MPIDYSKWKKIEVSDDEDDTHPNIHTPSLFQLRHRSRLEKMAALKEAREEVESSKQESSSRLKEIEEKLKETTLDEKERIRLELEKQKIDDEWTKFEEKERELEERERLQPWNVDTIGQEAWSKSIVNKVQEKKEEPMPVAKIDDEEDNRRMVKYFEDHQELLKQFAALESVDACEQFLLEHPFIASDYAASWMTVESLNLTMLEKDAEMEKCAANCITLQFLLDYARTFKALATNTNVLKEYFKKFRNAPMPHKQPYYDELESFKERLRKRAITKREELLQEYEADARQKRIAESPGGLDPQEVFDSLPEALRECFISHSVDKIKELSQRMDREVFEHHMQRCIDAGLWVPNANASAQITVADATVAGAETELRKRLPS